MPNTPFHHPFRIDTATLERASSAVGNGRLLSSSHLTDNVKFVLVNPIVFTHAFLLLGEQPQRFLSDLTLYLSTIKTFFERTDTSGGINIPSSANPDSRRRLSEDLGIALATIFMVEVFGLTWESISQIPQNSKLSKKRPDFQGYTGSNQRFLFEAKGTTKLSKIEASLSKALGQVKNYPEQAESKLAIVSYLSADERFFPSTSFVVDPPALPDEVEPDAETSRLLHFEKVLQYAGFSQTAKDYVSTLSLKLREQHRDKEEEPTAYRNIDHFPKPRIQYRKELESSMHDLERIKLRNQEFIGRYLVFKNTSDFKIFFGANRQVIESGIDFKPDKLDLQTRLDESETDITSFFSDGTILRITKLEKNIPI